MILKYKDNEKEKEIQSLIEYDFTFFGKNKDDAIPMEVLLSFKCEKMEKSLERLIDILADKYRPGEIKFKILDETSNIDFEAVPTIFRFSDDGENVCEIIGLFKNDK